LRPNPTRLTRIPRPALIICVLLVVAAAAGGSAAWFRSRHPDALPHPSCGAASTHFLAGDTKILRADRGALACFLTAAMQCKRASLGLTEMGVDTGTDYVFAIAPGDAPCQVTEERQDYSANFGGSQSAISTVPCRTVAVTSTGVALSCRGRSVLIPANVISRSEGPA
jgi:hypothetical protein